MQESIGNALRISTAIQTLLHSENQTVSLLRQLNLEDRNFLDSAIPFNRHNKLAHCTLVTMVLRPNGEGEFFAELDDRPMRFIPFEEWWHSPVLTTGSENQKTLSRQQLTEIMRNQDGGAHVDPRIDAAYQGMRNAINFKRSDGQFSTQDGELFAMRQIGHEVLKTLIPTYRRRPRRVDIGALHRELYLQLRPLKNVQMRKNTTTGIILVATYVHVDRSYFLELAIQKDIKNPSSFRLPAST